MIVCCEDVGSSWRRRHDGEDVPVGKRHGIGAHEHRFLRIRRFKRGVGGLRLTRQVFVGLPCDFLRDSRLAAQKDGQCREDVHGPKTQRLEVGPCGLCYAGLKRVLDEGPGIEGVVVDGVENLVERVLIVSHCGSVAGILPQKIERTSSIAYVES